MTKRRATRSPVNTPETPGTPDVANVKKTTKARILEASRLLFNEKSYAATSLAEIAASIGISQGNLTYHFSTKSELARAIEKEMRKTVRDRRKRTRQGAVTDDYVDLLLFSMVYSWENRFLLRDQAQFASSAKTRGADPDMVADLDLVHDFLRRMHKENLFRRDLDVDLRALARSLWIVSRYWMDHLRELEGLKSVAWADQERGLQHHFALLIPCLTASAKRELEAAVLRAAHQHAVQERE